MRVLIIGCGYTGSALGSRLAREAHTVTGVVASASSAEALRPLGIIPRMADCRTVEGALAACHDEADAVVFSLSSGGGNYREVYLGGLRHVLNALRGREPRLFLHIGSASVYPQTDGEWVTEESLAEPPPGNTRILRETEQVLIDGAKGRMTAFILRLSGIYGPGRHHLLDQLRTDTGLLSGNEGQWTNRIHREDIVEAICFLLNCKDPPSGARILNLSDDEPAPQGKVAKWLCQKLGRSAPSFSGDMTSSPRPKTNRRISNRALRALGWHPRFPSYREGFDAILAGES